MTIFSIDVEAQDGTRLGSGPLATASTISASEKLDQIGAVSVELPATDPRTALFVPNTLRYVRAFAERGGRRVQVAHGLIRKRGKGSKAKLLRLSGVTIAGELQHYHVGKLILGVETSPGSEEYDPMPAASVPAAIMAFAPGWTITGVPSQDVYLRLGDEKIPAALSKVCEITGDHWRLDPTTERQIEILPTTPTGFVPASSGVTAIEHGEGARLVDNPSVCLILDGLEEMADSTDRATRILPRGGGNEDAQLFINPSTLFSAPGNTPGDYTDGDYTMHIDADPNLSYIAYDPAETGGYIEAVETFQEIVPIKERATERIKAANMLVTAAKTALRQRLVEQRSYRLRVTKVQKPLVVGDAIHVTCRHYTDGYGWLLVDEPMLLLEVTPSYSADGGDPEYTLQVTQIAVDKWPVSGPQRFAQTVARLSGASSYKQKAASALTADTATTATSVDADATAVDTLVVESTTGQAIAGLSSTPGNNRSIAWYSLVAGVRVLRWILRVNSTAESGSNLGSDLELLARNDAGGAIATVLKIVRSTGYIGLQGVSSPTSFLHHGGSVAYAVTTLTGATTLNATHHTIRADASGGAFSLTLPLADTRVGREYRITRINSGVNQVTLARSGSDVIAGGTSYVLTAQWQSVTVVATATGEWSVL